MDALVKNGQRGAVLIFVIILMVMMGIAASMFVSLLATESFSSAGHSSSTEAFFVSFGGVEIAQRALAQDMNWYQSAQDPVVIPTTSFGVGSFAVMTYRPASELSSRIADDDATGPIDVHTTDRFPSPGYLQIKNDDDDDDAGAEFIRYTGKDGNAFTGITRNVDIGDVQGEASPHEAGSRVYPVTTLLDRLKSVGDPCTPEEASPFRIDTHPKFLTAGTVDIEGEEISYSGSTNQSGDTFLSGVVRCRNLTSSSHSRGKPVTPLLSAYEVEVVSTGSRSGIIPGENNAERVLRKIIQR